MINGERTVADYKHLLPQFIDWYNHARTHQSLSYQTPAEVLKQMPYGYMDKAKAFPTYPQGQQQPIKALLIYGKYKHTF